MSGDEMVEITVLCPSSKAEDVAREISGTYKTTTRFNDGSREYVGVGTRSGGVHSAVSIPPLPPLQGWTLNVQGDLRSYQDDSLRAGPRAGVDELKPVHSPGAASCGDKGPSEHLRMMSGYAETLACVMHHMSEITNAWVNLANLHDSSPSLDARSGAGHTASVRERPGCCGDSARPGHPNP